MEFEEETKKTSIDVAQPDLITVEASHKIDVPAIADELRSQDTLCVSRFPCRLVRNNYFAKKYDTPIDRVGLWRREESGK